MADKLSIADLDTSFTQATLRRITVHALIIPYVRKWNHNKTTISYHVNIFRRKKTTNTYVLKLYCVINTSMHTRPFILGLKENTLQVKKLLTKEEVMLCFICIGCSFNPYTIMWLKSW